MYYSQDEEEGETRDVEVSLSTALLQAVVQLGIQSHGSVLRQLPILPHRPYGI